MLSRRQTEASSLLLSDVVPLESNVVVLSPHLDDAVWSIGALISGLTRCGRQVQVITAFSEIVANASNIGIELVNRSGLDLASATERRKEEDRNAIESLGAGTRRLCLLDAICRAPEHYATRVNLAGEHARIATNDPGQTQLRLALELPLRELRPTLIIAPLAIGGHVDHQVVARVAFGLQAEGHRVLFFEDFPYCALTPFVPPRLVIGSSRMLQRLPYVMPIDTEVDRHVTAACMYTSQVLAFFGTNSGLSEQLLSYLGGVATMAGYAGKMIRLWSIKPTE